MSNWPIMNKPAILIIGIIYMALCLGIGFWAMRKNKSSKDFFAANKSIGSILLVFGTFTACLSGHGFVGGPGLAYSTGIGAIWIAISLPLGFFLSWMAIGRKFRQISLKRTILSVPDVLYARFESNALRFIAGLAILVGVIGYLSAQMMATGWVMVVVFGVDFNVGLVSGLFIVAAYSVAGGVLAGLYTDVVQGIAMLGGAICIAVIAFLHFEGITPMWDILSTENPLTSGPFGTSSPVWALTFLMMGFMGAMGQPHAAARFFMMKDTKSLRWSSFLSALGYAVSTLLILFIGNFIRAKVIQGELDPLASPDMASIVFLVEYAPVLMAGIVLAGLLGAIMSTTAAFLSVGSASVVRDIAQAVRGGRPILHELLWARVVTVLILVVAVIMAFNATTLVSVLGIMGWSFFSATLGPVLLFGMNWKRTSRQGALAGIIFGFAVTFSLEALSALGLFAFTNGLVNGAVGFLGGIILLIAVSLGTKDKADRDMAPDIYEIIAN